MHMEGGGGWLSKADYVTSSKCFFCLQGDIKHVEVSQQQVKILWTFWIALTESKANTAVPAMMWISSAAPVCSGLPAPFAGDLCL